MRQNICLSIVQFAYMAAFAAYFNFLLLFMSENGYTAMECGIAQSLTAFVTLTAQPILGYITDTYVSYKKLVTFGLIAASITCFLLPVTINYFLLAMISIVLHSAFVRQFPTIIDAWTIGIREKDPKISYGLTRGLGSLGEGLSALFVGFLIAKSGFIMLFIAHSTLLLIAAVFSLFLIDIQPKNKIKTDRDNKTTGSKPKEILLMLFKNKLYITFLLSAVLMNIGLKIISIFASLIVKNLGGGSESFGTIMFTCGLLELPTFIIISKMAKKVELKFLYIIGILTFTIGGLTAVAASNIVVFLIGRTLTSITYAIYLPVMVEYIAKIIEPQIRSTSMAIIGALAGGGAHIVSGLVGGYIMDNMGMRYMLFTLIGIMVTTFISFIPNLLRKEIKVSVEE